MLLQHSEGAGDAKRSALALNFHVPTVFATAMCHILEALAAKKVDMFPTGAEAVISGGNPASVTIARQALCSTTSCSRHAHERDLNVYA
jgi:hypothetical protein